MHFDIKPSRGKSIVEDKYSHVCNKNVYIKYSAHDAFLIRYAQSYKIGKPNNLNVSVTKKNKWSKQDSKNGLISPMSEGIEPLF